MNVRNGDPAASIRKDFGDWQTPPGLVDAVLDRLGPIGGRFDRVLEPTCGHGAFLAGLLRRPDRPREIRGFEIQPAHCEAARAVAAAAPRDVRAVVELADLFRVDLGALDWAEAGRLLVVGNLPWVTVAGLGASGGVDTAPRSNPHGSRGLDALTGASNFDISEALWIKLIRELAHERPTIALLGKTAVARNLFRTLELADLPVVTSRLYRIDAHRWFGAAVDAGLLVAEIGPGEKARELPVHDGLDAPAPSVRIGRSGNRLIADLDAYRKVAHADGICGIEWRQGIKHDAADVMELVDDGDRIRNRRGEVVDVEPEYLFPLLKGSDLAAKDGPRPRRLVIVTQPRLNHPTDALEQEAPRLWRYLQDHAEDFDRRRSSIYRGRPRFALFGVGDYTFAPGKVAVSGFHKEPKFRAIAPVDGRPVLFDDTCYFLPFETPAEAEEVAALLNGREALDLIQALSFRDAKRPITKALLGRLDLAALRRIGDHDRPPSPLTTATHPTRPTDGFRDDPVSEPVLAESIGLQHHLPR
ncbi:class I SAM-dependent methyltransferase [Tundrisphaera sp. TA3]|uniref:class I SAM-dependent methyltransferase n=1 Tax=Tundrisphaera sp. TA3 TaxID=3435775 RepID=UPI003EB90874